ncbi:MAG: hypothetical protein HY735_26210 [Verrucomicrobia bacterium]|nr:hypothetical protein [Verrucomicrobiota bacterium]
MDYKIALRDFGAATATVLGIMLCCETQGQSQGFRMFGARGSGFPHGIIVSFSQPLEPASATNKSNYQLSGQNVSVEGAALLSGNQVLLTVPSFNTEPLTVTVNNVKDASAAGNTIAANSKVSVAFRSNLAGYWNFDEGQTTNTLDAAGGYDGTLINGPTWVADAPTLGRPNPFALQFDGVDDYVQTTYAGVGGTRPRAVSFWLKTDVSPPNTHGIIAWGNSSANSLKYHVRLETTTGSIRTEAQGGNNWATTALNDGAWHHVVSMLPSGVVAENNSVVHYVDGALDEKLGGSNVAINTDITSASAFRVRIGARDQTGTLQAFPGLIDEVAIYDGDLTPQQIAQLAKGADPFLFGKPFAAPLTLDRQPDDASVSEVETATFSVAASGSPVVGYQWFKNGQPVSGAQGSTYTTAPTTPADDQAKIHAEVFNLDGTFNRITSRTVTLTVRVDRDPPKIVSARGIGSGINRVVIQFDEPLNQGLATNLSTYRIQGINITQAALDTNRTEVTLSTDALTDGTTYSLSITGLKDATVAGNVLTTTVEFKSRATFPDLVLADNPVRFWRFNERAGSTVLASETSARDPISTANISNIQGAPNLNAESLLANDPDSSGIAFDGTRANQVLVAPNGSDLNTTAGPWAKKSIEFWVKARTVPPSGGTGASIAWGIYEQGGGDRGFGIYLFGTKPGSNPDEANLTFSAINRIDDGAGSPWGDPAVPDEGAVTEFAIKTNTVYHVVAVMDGDGSDNLGADGKLLGSLKLYVNGKLVDESKGVGLLYNHTSDVQIGRGNFRDHANFSGAHGWFDGVLDELAVYNQALTPERVKAHFDAAFAGLETGAIQITKQPADTSAPERGEAVFSVEFAGSSPWKAQWFLNDKEIPGPVTRAGISTISFLTTAADHGAKVKVLIANNTSQATSREAILSIIPDTTPPQIASIQGGAGQANNVVIRFNEPVERASAENRSNYTIAGLNVLTATLSADGKEVSLTTSQQTAGSPYNLQIIGVKDLAVAGNAFTSSVTFIPKASYRIEVLADQPDVYFTLADASGTVAVDLIGKDPGYAGTYTTLAAGGAPPKLGAERLVPGAPDPAVEFAAASFNLVAFNTDSTFVNTIGPFVDKTYELWFKANRLPKALPGGAVPEKMVLWEQGGTTRGISIYLSGTQDSQNPTEAALYFHAWNDSADGTGAPWGGPEEESKTPVFVKTMIQANRPYHAVMVLDGDNTDALAGRVDGYLNGQKINMPGNENLKVGQLYAHGDNAGLGGINQNTVYHDQNRTVANGDYFDGSIDEFAIYSKVLSASRILAHYNQGLISVPLETAGADLRITAIRTAAGNLTIEWTGGGLLQSAEAVTGPYSTVAGATSPFTEPIAAGKSKFYRVSRNP